MIRCIGRLSALLISSTELNNIDYDKPLSAGLAG